MKKVKLIKSLLISAPIIVTPLLANSCDSKKDSGSKPIPATKINDNAGQLTPFSTLTPATTVDAEYYVDALAGTLKTALDGIADQVVATATTSTNTLNITSVINTAKTEAKKIATVDPDNIDNINLAFNGTGNLKVEKNNDTYTLTIYPSFINSDSAEQTLTTTLSLTFDSNTDTQAITNTYDVAKGFKNYTTSDGLGNNIVRSISASSDGNIIYAGTDGGFSVGTKSGNTYNFTNYTTNDGLVNNTVFSLYASSDGNTIYLGTIKGISIATKSGNTYTFANYTAGLGNTFINAIYPINNGDTIYIGTNGGGVSVGTKKGSTYVFDNYTTSDGLGNNITSSILASNDGNTVYVGTTQGVSVGTKQNDDSYKFANYNAGLGDINTNSVYTSSDGSTIYAGTNGGVSVGTKSGNTYNFTNYTTSDGLGNNVVHSVYTSSDGSTIYAGTNGGVSVGTKQNDDSYKFANYNAGLGNDQVLSVYPSSNSNTIYESSYDGGVAISAANWLTQNNLNYAVNNHQAIVLNNKNNN